MANELDNLTGKVFGLLTVVARAANDVHENVWWSCRCSCGALVKKRASQLRTGRFFTCGALACRFWEKVYRPTGAGCWEWTGATNGDYGVLKIPGSKKLVRAHVFSYELATGTTAEVVRHSCDNGRCVRPDHLVGGTHQDNMNDMKDRDRSHSSRRKVPAEVRQQIKNDCRYGLSQEKAAQKYGVVPRTVQRILQEPDLH